MKKNEKPKPSPKQETLSRKEAIKKIGKYTAYTTVTMSFLVLSPKAEASNSNPGKPGGDTRF